MSSLHVHLSVTSHILITRFPLQSDTDYLDFGTVIVGNVAYKHLVLTNDSECGMHYKLHMQQTINSPYDDRAVSDSPSGKESFILSM